jgi:hypothetical protein
MTGDPQEPHDIGDEEAMTLKPCPCCGNVADFGMCEDDNSSDFGGWFVECTNDRCRLTTPLVFPLGDDPRERLREIWNKRRNADVTGLAPGKDDK